MPISIVVGAEDQIVDVERQSVRLHRALPHSDLHIVPGLGHMVHHGAAEVVADAIEAVASVSRRSAPRVSGKAEMPAVPEHT
jgi:pimeloyl-ACP methyl ester carboxylesterase